VAAPVPLCRNFAQKRDCPKSDMRLKGEDDSCWIFQCRSCELVQVVSKDAVQDKSKFELAKKRMEEERIMQRLRDSRRKIFA